MTDDVICKQVLSVELEYSSAKLTSNRFHRRWFTDGQTDLHGTMYKKIYIYIKTMTSARDDKTTFCKWLSGFICFVLRFSKLN